MIEVRMAEYCENCPWFDPSIDGGLLYSNNQVIHNGRKIVCQNEKLCAYVAGKVASMSEAIDKLPERGTKQPLL